LPLASQGWQQTETTVTEVGEKYFQLLEPKDTQRMMNASQETRKKKRKTRSLFAKSLRIMRPVRRRTQADVFGFPGPAVAAFADKNGVG
jgi:hypothetical protein